VCIVIGGALVKVAERIGAPQAPETLPALTQAVRFEFSAPSARNVSIVGDFNRWQPDALRRSASGRWEIEIPLTPGRYAYSFVVDGHLAPDPLAPRATSEDFGSPSSIRLVRGL
jgi:1,4-alpha-glucan branching enzyme